jgi:hypothetical protein
MRLTFSALAIATLLASAACSAHGDTTTGPDGDRSPVSGPLTVTRLRAEPYSLTFNSGIFDSARVVIQGEAAFRQSWTQIWNRQWPEPELPQVDFAREQVIVAALGARNSGGYGIIIESAYQHADYVEVVVHKTSPGSRCATTAALTQPVDAARIPATALPVRFRERSTVIGCD